MYKAMQAGLGEYLSGMAKDINASTDIKADLQLNKTNKKKYNFSDNPIIGLKEYVRLLSDGVKKILPDDIAIEVSDEAITFTQNGEVLYIQPVDEIVPEQEDLDKDIDDLASAVQGAEYESAWDDTFDDYVEDYDDPDYATRAIKLSTDDGDLDYITGEDAEGYEAEDYGFGFDSNGEPVTESMVEELERIAQEILDKSNLCKEIDQYASIKQFNYYASVPYVQESFFITFTYTADYYELSERDVLYEDGFYTTNAPYEFNFNVYCKNGEVEYAECLGLSPKDVKMFSVDRLELFAERLVAPVASEIYNATTNI